MSTPPPEHHHDGPLDTVRTLLAGVWKRRWLAISVASAVALVAAIAIPLVPQRYESSARFYVDTQSVLKPLMAGLAFHADFDQQVRLMARTLISRPNVERVMAQAGLQDSMSADERERTVTRLMTGLKLQASDVGNLYTISYRDADPLRAQRVVQGIVDLFVEQSTGQKKRDTEDATRFLDEQIRTHEAKLVEAENRLKDFKVRNFGATGVSDKDYFTRISTMQDDLNKLRSDLRAAEQARDAYRRELAAENPQLPASSDTDIALAAQRKQLDELMRRYTDQHPDVVFTRQTIAELEARKRSGVDAGGSRAAATSPVYQKIRVSLAETEAEVATLRGRVAAEQQRLDQTRTDAGRVPQVEAELAQLNRDYELIRKNYDQLVARRESASLGTKLEETARLADFRIVEPPKMAQAAAAPNHRHLAAMAVLGALLAGLLAPWLLEQLRPTVESAAALRELSRRPVAGSVSLVASVEEQAAERRQLLWFGGAIALLLLFQGTWLVWIMARSTLH